MINNKPLIIGKRPFWSHPVFPWGWYSLTQDIKLVEHGQLESGGYYKPGDGGGGLHVWLPKDEPAEPDDGTIFQVDECTSGRWKNAREHIKQIAIQKIKFQLYW